MPQTTINVAALYSALDSKREHERLSWREVAVLLGVSSSTFTRIAQGARPDVDTFATLLAWLGMPATEFMQPRPQGVTRDNVAVQMSSYLRAADDLTPDQAQALDTIMQAAYKSIVGR